MKTKWYFLVLLTVLVGLSLTAVRVQAAALDFYGGMQLDDGGGDGGQLDEPAECFPVTLSDDGGGTDGGDGDTEPAE